MCTRRSTAAAVIFVTAAIAGSPVAADICADLNARLSATERSPGGADRQQLLRELQRARNIAAGQRCRPGFLFFGASGGPECERVLAAIRQLQAQLGRQSSSRRGFFGRPENDRRIILDQMARFDCPVVPGYGANGYETVCVRHCDGYFFQIGVSHDRGNFNQDARLCRAHYPGEGQASLYYRPLGAEPETLVSIDGKAYVRQSYALRYQATYDPSCPRPLKILSPMEMAVLQKAADQYGLKGGEAGDTAIPLPDAKPSATSDPETAALRNGDFSVEQARRLVADAQEPRPMRIVGPVAAQMLPADFGPPKAESAGLAIDRATQAALIPR